MKNHWGESPNQQWQYPKNKKSKFLHQCEVDPMDNKRNHLRCSHRIFFKRCERLFTPMPCCFVLTCRSRVGWELKNAENERGLSANGVPANLKIISFPSKPEPCGMNIWWHHHLCTNSRYESFTSQVKRPNMTWLCAQSADWCTWLGISTLEPTLLCSGMPQVHPSPRFLRFFRLRSPWWTS